MEWSASPVWITLYALHDYIVNTSKLASVVALACLRYVSCPDVDNSLGDLYPAALVAHEDHLHNLKQRLIPLCERREYFVQCFIITNIKL